MLCISSPKNKYSVIKIFGRTFNILAKIEQADEFFSEGETGEIINDAVYLRNRMVEEKFNVVIKAIGVKGDWGNKAVFINTLKSSIMAGDAAYDLVDGYAAYIGDLVVMNLFYNLLEIPHLRLTESWWSQNAVNELTVNGKLFIIPGDISVNLWENMLAIFFNKKLLTDMGLEDPYALVKNGDWTVTFDFGSVFAIQTKRAGYIIRDSVHSKREYVSAYEKQKNMFNIALDEFLNCLNRTEQPKSESSNKRLKLSSELVTLLKQQKHRQVSTSSALINNVMEKVNKRRDDAVRRQKTV